MIMEDTIDNLTENERLVLMLLLRFIENPDYDKVIAEHQGKAQ